MLQYIEGFLLTGVANLFVSRVNMDKKDDQLYHLEVLLKATNQVKQNLNLIRRRVTTSIAVKHVKYLRKLA